MVWMNRRHRVFRKRCLLVKRFVERDTLFGATEAWVADADRPRIRHLAKVLNRAVGVGLRTLAAEGEEAVTEPVPLVAVLAGKAAGVEVRAARAVLVDRAPVGEERTPLVVERGQRAQGDELEHRAEEVVGVRRATRES